MPYLWSVTGIGYNVAMVERARSANAAPRDSLALLFDPAIAAEARRLRHRDARHAAGGGAGGARLSRPRPARAATPPISTARSALLERIRPYVRQFHSSQYINDLAAGDICVALGYSGDVIQARNRAREAGSAVEIAFRVPREGAQMSIDMLGIPADAPHPDNAHRFIDYILRPDVIAAITNAVSYPNPNLAATALVDPEIRDDPGIYPPRCGARGCSISTSRRRAPTSGRARAPGTGSKSGC